MSDAAFRTADFPGFTTTELRSFVSKGFADPEMDAKARAELDRRERALAGDVSVMTQAERLRFVKTGRAR
jgi:hypothetical protein